ncbi:DNA-directed RNA polymerase sigma-70 factor [Bacillus sp. J14TS2]|uniref:sigma-70 family RNA polymerase sigma factor n=1 Tax=Bacillus sp. J14TS2 TaxID=2807188 RepID=UPI001B07199F|nr:sigma-70 family RNA polymerase sigma factor [Bacillus sp. J14TS2]GIN71888.1 DNA-directed RNA polymerase sigma-70 factor [Bacillus sp. J14TS2]
MTDIEVVVINQLVKKAQKGDEKAYLTLFQHYQVDIYRIAYVYVKNQEDALDIVQETAYKSFSKIKTLKNPEYFKTWVIRIAMNTAISHLRKGKKIVHLNPEYADMFAADEKDVSLQMTLKDLIESLNENEKSVVLLKFYVEHTISEIADVLDMPLGTVKTILYRSLDKLRKQVKREDIYGQ